MQAATQKALERPSEIVASTLGAGRSALDERDAKRLLATYGVPLPAGGLARSRVDVDLGDLRMVDGDQADRPDDIGRSQVR